MPPRAFTSYETKQLQKHGMEPSDVARFGDTPVEYITGFAEFYGREFAVDQRVMIPRVETEEMIAEAIRAIGAKAPISLTIADVGTGSGCIGITLFLEILKHHPAHKPTACLSDVSRDTLVVAKRNAGRLLNKAQRINTAFLQSDIFNNYPPLLRFDIICANLPYVPTRRIPALQSSVKNYEPHLALDGGARGLALIQKLIKQAKNRLKAGGFMLLEIDETHRFADFADARRYFRAEIKKDSFGKNRFLLVQYPKKLDRVPII